MEENEGTKICSNCNREIPAVNYVTHSLHCVRNIKICPVCKEPVLTTELEAHNERLHSLVPCNQCGERVRGTDMEDHIRDSCAFTMQTCRFCSLDNRRRELPAHERYCGARTERCAECGEYVQLRYRQLHLDTNHGFVRLNDGETIRSRCRRSQEQHARTNPQRNRYSLLAELGIQIPDYEDPLDNDFFNHRPRRNAAGPNSVNNGFGQNAGAQNEPGPNAAEQNAQLEATRQRILLRYHYVAPNSNAPDVVEQNERRRDGARRNRIVARARYADAPDVVDETARLDAIRRNLYGSNLFVNLNASAPDVVIGQNGVRREGARQTIVGSIVVIARNRSVPDVVDRDASARDAGQQNTEAANAVAGPSQNVVRPDSVGQHVQTPDVRTTQQQDASGQNVGAGNIGPAVPVFQNVGTRDAVVQYSEEDMAADEVDMAAEEAARNITAEQRAVIDSILDQIPETDTDMGELEEFFREPLMEANARPNRVILKRTNDQPQINTSVAAQDKVDKFLGPRSAVKKRPAPAAPATSAALPLGPPPVAPSPMAPVAPVAPAAPVAPPNPRRDQPYYSALQRRQDEDRRRQEQTAYNLSVGLPPVLDPAAKLEKLRKMDALHNREAPEPWERPRAANNNTPAGHTLGRGDTTDNGTPVPLSELQPMSAEQFMARFNQLQLIREPRDIRHSLRELRRGLNEVTAPYNNSMSNNNNTNKNNNSLANSVVQIVRESLMADGVEQEQDQLDEARGLDPIPLPAPPPAGVGVGGSPESDVMVPCEFCCRPLRAQDILEHERACRESLQLGRALPRRAPGPASPGRPGRLPSPPPLDAADDVPVIPCEFCTETMPYYLISEHQELCGRETHLLYPD